MRVPLLFLCSLVPVTAIAADPLPFKITDYRIPAPAQVVLVTDHTIDSIAGLNMDIALKGATAALMNASLERLDSRRLILRLPQSLTKGQNYELRLISDDKSSITIQSETKSGPFTGDAFPISTKPAATIEPSYTFEELGTVFFVKSKIGLLPLSAGKSFNLLDYTGRVKNNLTTREFRLEPQDNPLTTGWVKVVLDNGLSQQSARLQATGITNIFGDNVETDTAAIALAPIPKDKTDASLYMKLSHQAGSGLPAWILNGKLAPATGKSFWGGWRALPSLDVDIGNRAVGTTKTNDVIKPAFGLSRLFRFDGFVEGIRMKPAISYETNRKGTTGNLLADIDAQFKFQNSYNPMAYKQRQKWLDAVSAAQAAKAAGQPAITDIKMDEITAPFGWGVQFFLGAELGGATNERKVQASKGKAGDSGYEVQLPKFPVARLRPKVRTFIEVWRVTLDATFTPRYLFTREYYSFESSNSKQVFLGDLKGWSSYVEPSLTFRLDSSGHIALSATWKHGIVPPSYVRANTVQSGLEFKF